MASRNLLPQNTRMMANLLSFFWGGGSFGMFFVICITIVWLPLRRGIFSC